MNCFETALIEYSPIVENSLTSSRTDRGSSATYREHYAERHPVLSETGEAQLINSFIPDECPHCANVIVKMNGHTKNGVQRYKCSDCKKTFTPVTRTIFDGHKISLSEWVEYTLISSDTLVYMQILGTTEMLLQLHVTG